MFPILIRRGCHPADDDDDDGTKVLPESKDLPLSKLLLKICSDILVLMVFESKCSDRFTSRLFMNDMHDMEGVIKGGAVAAHV